MDNPFSFSNVVGGLAFCNRDREQTEIKRFIRSSQNVLLYSHRRRGKTSLILKIFNAIKGVTPVYIDLYGTTGIEDFITAFLKSISAIEPKMNRLADIVYKTIRNLTIQFSVDPQTGLPVATPTFTRAPNPPALDEIFELAKALSRKTKMVIAFDEFQEIGKYGETAFEQNLRKSIQHHDNIAYLFAGSQRHLLLEMFNNAKRAFFRQAVSYPLEQISTAEYVKWIKGLYRRDRRNIDRLWVEMVVDKCDHHPMYIQEFFFNLWPESKLSPEIIQQVEDRIVNRRAIEYAYAWDAFSLNQRKSLKLIDATGGKNLFAADTLSRFGFRSASQVKSALDTLQRDEFVIKNSSYQIQDPLFRRWIHKLR